MKILLKFITLHFLFIVSKSIAQNQPARALDPQKKQELVDSISLALNNYYVFPEKGALMAAYLKKQFLNRMYDPLSDPDQFANAVVKDIRSVYADLHLSIRYDPDLEKRIITFAKTFQIDKTDIQKEKKQNFFFKKAEILPGNIGYVAFTNFADTNELSRKTVRAAMQFVAYTDALIIDLRNNFGGNGAMAAELQSYFYNHKTLTGRSYNRLTNSWTDNWIDNDPVITKGLSLNMPVYLLTGGRTFSAAEGLAYALQHLKNATVIGDTTKGGAHLTRSFALGNGFVAFIPYSRGENVITKTDWEGSGVIPTISIKESNALVKAQEEILSVRLFAAKDDEEKRKLKWLLNDLKAKNNDLRITPAVLHKYAGEFEEFVFTIENDELYCTNTHQKNKHDKLKAISETLFSIDEQSQVEFIKDSNSNYSTMKLFWDDGWVDTIKKSK